MVIFKFLIWVQDKALYCRKFGDSEVPVSVSLLSK